MEQQKVIISDNLEKVLAEAISECKADKTFVLTDENTSRLCLPLTKGMDCMADYQEITIGAGDECKSLEAVAHVWGELQRMGATRHSLLVNIGGGMVTDLGGFAASTFKRGIHLINIPTTLLSMVDASVGGKTGFNFGGLKNEIGVFRNASSVIIDTVFLKTMDSENLLSGYAEMLKHGLISNNRMWAELLNYDVCSCKDDLDTMRRMIAESIDVKKEVVRQDPTEKGLRKALNLGHTVGHAFESLALQRKPVLHGYAVAWGLVCELYLSVIKTGFPSDKMHQTVRFILDNYGRMPITCDDYPTLIELMTHDKKNTSGEINFSLLSDIGELKLNQTATIKEIEEALDFYREG